MKDQEWNYFLERNNYTKDSKYFMNMLYVNMISIKTIMEETLAEMRLNNNNILAMEVARPKVFFDPDDKSAIMSIHFPVNGPYFTGRHGLSFIFENHVSIVPSMACWADSENIKPFLESIRKIIRFFEGKYTPDFTKLTLEISDSIGVYAETEDGDMLLATVPKTKFQDSIIGTLISNLEYDLVDLEETLGVEVYSIYKKEVN